LTGAVQDESQLQEDASKLASWQLAVQESKQIESSKLVSSQFRMQRLAVWAAGRGAGSALHCHCVGALREGPLTGAVQDDSQLQEDASKLEASSVINAAVPSRSSFPGGHVRPALFLCLALIRPPAF